MSFQVCAIVVRRFASGGLGARRAAGHTLEDFGPVFGVLDGVAHQQQEGFFVEIAPPAFTAVELDVMAAAALGERVPFARRFDRPSKRCVRHASGSRVRKTVSAGQAPNARNATTDLRERLNANSRQVAPSPRRLREGPRQAITYGELRPALSTMARLFPGLLPFGIGRPGAGQSLRRSRFAISPMIPRRNRSTQATKITPWITVTHWSSALR